MACGILAVQPMTADTWPGFRGDGSGVTAAKNLPIRWNPEDSVAWKAAVRGYGQSAPVVWKDRIFVTSADGPNQEQSFVHAYRLADGQLLWTREFAPSQPLKNMFRNSRAAPTCVADAAGVYALFPTGELVGLTHAGETRWQRSLVKDYGEFQNGRGLSSSLAQTEDAVIALVDHEGPSYTLAVNKQTGENRWKAERGQQDSSWSSPLVAYPFGKPVVILSSCETLEVLDGDTGRWQCRLLGLVGNRIPSAGLAGAQIFVGACEAEHIPMDPRDVCRSNCCLKLVQTNGRLRMQSVWTSRKAVSYYSTPLAYQGCVYYVNKVGLLFCLDQQTGEEHYVQRIGGPCWASAIGGAGHVYLFLKEGEIIVIKAGPKFEPVATNRAWPEDDEPAAEKPPAAAPQPPLLPPGGGPPDLDSMDEGLLKQIFAYGDPILYGAAAVEGALVLRTGETLICVRSATETGGAGE
jgi:outer membrane protein assembly factor BamB